MPLDRLLSITAAGIPVALWVFLIAVVIVSIVLSVRLIGRPPHHQSRS